MFDALLEILDALVEGFEQTVQLRLALFLEGTLLGLENLVGQVPELRVEAFAGLFQQFQLFLALLLLLGQRGFEVGNFLAVTRVVTRKLLAVSLGDLEPLVQVFQLRVERRFRNPRVLQAEKQGDADGESARQEAGDRCSEEFGGHASPFKI